MSDVYLGISKRQKHIIMKKRFSYWTQIEKPRVIAGIDKAGITNKEAVKAILRFTRFICTCCNMKDRGVSWESMTYSVAFSESHNSIQVLNANGGYGMRDSEYFKEWEMYCEATGICTNANVGDWLA